MSNIRIFWFCWSSDFLGCFHLPSKWPKFCIRKSICILGLMTFSYLDFTQWIKRELDWGIKSQVSGQLNLNSLFLITFRLQYSLWRVSWSTLLQVLTLDIKYNIRKCIPYWNMGCYFTTILLTGTSYFGWRMYGILIKSWLPGFTEITIFC